MLAGKWLRVTVSGQVPIYPIPIDASIMPVNGSDIELKNNSAQSIIKVDDLIFIDNF